MCFPKKFLLQRYKQIHKYMLLKTLFPVPQSSFDFLSLRNLHKISDLQESRLLSHFVRNISKNLLLVFADVLHG